MRHMLRCFKHMVLTSSRSTGKDQASKDNHCEQLIESNMELLRKALSEQPIFNMPEALLLDQLVLLLLVKAELFMLVREVMVDVQKEQVVSKLLMEQDMLLTSIVISMEETLKISLVQNKYVLNGAQETKSANRLITILVERDVIF